MRGLSRSLALALARKWKTEQEQEQEQEGVRFSSTAWRRRALAMDANRPVERVCPAHLRSTKGGKAQQDRRSDEPARDDLGGDAGGLPRIQHDRVDEDRAS